MIHRLGPRWPPTSHPRGSQAKPSALCRLKRGRIPARCSSGSFGLSSYSPLGHAQNLHGSVGLVRPYGLDFLGVPACSFLRATVAAPLRGLRCCFWSRALTSPETSLSSFLNLIFG